MADETGESFLDAISDFGEDTSIQERLRESTEILRLRVGTPEGGDFSAWFNHTHVHPDDPWRSFVDIGPTKLKLIRSFAVVDTETFTADFSVDESDPNRYKHDPRKHLQPIPHNDIGLAMAFFLEDIITALDNGNATIKPKEGGL